MKTILLFACIVYLGNAVTTTASTTTTPQPSEPIVHSRTAYQLGSKECTFGPRFWCQNLTNAVACHATKHCIQTVWVHQKLPPDHSSVCETCLKMVKEARDQLLSNETQEEIKEVFEGSCKLIPIRIVAKECCKLMDEFAPELIDALASQMNPQVVCSIAGLCNNERVQELIGEESRNNIVISKSNRKMVDTCEGCHTVIKIVEKKFHQATRDQILQHFLQICGKMGSLADGCSNIIITYFNEIYKHLEDNLNANEFCLMSGECSAMFHTHANVEITPLANTGVVPVGGDNLPCDLCKQLVHHLQDILIANTTEEEFHTVLLGICKQTKSFKEECISLVEEYYPQIYNFLVNELNGSVLCSLIDICPGPGLMFDKNAPIAPLLPIETAQNVFGILHPVEQVSISKGQPLETFPASQLVPLPIERLMPQTLTVIGNTELCAFCTYFLHYVQQFITDPAIEEKLEYVVNHACEALPDVVTETCEAFVKTYGPAFIAILAQDIDPSTVCPKLSLCATIDFHKIHNVDVFMHRNKGEKPNCPLCLFAITSLEELIKDKRTEDSIKKGLRSLCSHLNGAVAEECSDFVEAYTDQIVTLLLKEISPQDVCIYLKLCEQKLTIESLTTKIQYGGEIETNQIYDSTANGKIITHSEVKVDADVCLLCEFLMSELENVLKTNSTEAEIEEALDKICNSFSSKYIKTHCLDFVRDYGDYIIQAMVNYLSPRDVCKKLHLCKDEKREQPQVTNLMIDYEEHNETSNQVHIKSPQCALCKVVMTQIEKMLNGSVNESEILKAIEKVCKLFPSQETQCDKFIEQYGKEMINFLKYALEPSEFCSIAGLCGSNKLQLEVRKCAVCEVAVDVMDKILKNPNVDKALEHVFEKTCQAFITRNQSICRTILKIYGEKIIYMLESFMKPIEICQEIKLCSLHNYRPEVLVGSSKCTRGPGYWCQSITTATECHAVEHCQMKIWRK